VATFLMTFLRINLPNFVQFKQYEGKPGTRDWNSFKAKEENILATRIFFLPQTAAL